MTCKIFYRIPIHTYTCNMIIFKIVRFTIARSYKSKINHYHILMWKCRHKIRV